MTRRYSVLVTEDDPGVAKGILFGLKEEGFEVYHASTASGALDIVRSEEPSVVLLDLRLPDMSGFDLCKQLRAERYTMPIIMVTARDEELDRVLGLEIGADDYVIKPFSLRELVSRIRAHIRRSYGPYDSTDGTIRIGDISIDQRRVTVLRADREVRLTPIEYKLLLHMANNVGISLSRDRLIEVAWGPGLFLENERTVDVHIRHLREKLESNPAEPALIQTVRGFGYRLVGEKADDQQSHPDVKKS